MRKTYCDRCGGGIYDDSPSYPKLMFKYHVYIYDDGEGTDNVYKDLCVSCKRSIINFIKQGDKGGDMR